jgi:hypothetical protein
MEKCYEIALFDNGYNALKTYEFDTMEDTQKQLKNLVENREGFRYIELSVIYIEDDEQIDSCRIADIDLYALEC